MHDYTSIINIKFSVDITKTYIFFYFIENILIPENREWLINIVDLSKKEVGSEACGGEGQG